MKPHRCPVRIAGPVGLGAASGQRNTFCPLGAQDGAKTDGDSSDCWWTHPGITTKALILFG